MRYFKIILGNWFFYENLNIEKFLNLLQCQILFMNKQSRNLGMERLFTLCPRVIIFL